MATSVRARVLALSGGRTWVVVDGCLPRPAAPCLRDLLGERCEPGSLVFLDLRGARLAAGEEGAGAFLPAGPRAFHVLADGPLRALLTADRRVTLYGTAEDVWRVWCLT